jgi:hypothetical protein
MEKVFIKIHTTLFGIILILLIFFDKRVGYSYQNPLSVPNYVLAVVLLFLVLAGYVLIPKIKIKKSGNFTRRLGRCSLIVLIIQMFLLVNIFFYTDWDVGTINMAASQLIETGTTVAVGYFQCCSNNVFLLAIVMGIRRIAGIFHFPETLALSACATLLVNLSLYVTGLTIYQIFKNEKTAWGGYLLALLLYGFNPWFCIAYSDTFSVLIPVLTLYVYLWMKDSSLPLLSKALLVIFPAMFGYLIKPQNVIVLIAIGIWQMICLGRKVFTGNGAKKIGIVLLALVITAGLVGGINSAGRSYTGIERNKDAEYGWSHYLVVGLNRASTGTYNEEDIAFTDQFPTAEERTTNHLIEAKRRIREMGLSGYLDFMAKKLLLNYNDGTFAWSMEGTFYAEVFDPPLGAMSTFFRNIYYYGGKYYQTYALIEQIVWLFVLAGGFAATLRSRHSTHREAEFILAISLVGITLFTLIFEARARYLYLYAPFYVILAVMGWCKNRR